MRTISKDELKEIVERHGKRLRDKGGERDNLSGANMTDANLINANMTDANLSGANLSRANLINANMTDANLSGANMTGADLTGANMTGANMTGANMTGANLSLADLTFANLTDANLSGANLTDAVGGSGDRIQCLQINPYKIIILDKTTVWGGCTKKTAKQWLKYSGKELSESDKKYLETVTKPFIRMVCGDSV